ncbi:MAG: nuclear transport factor 2 family protein [Solirubrobacterales bacterium]|nr:nuclear transport factor 2 family protein [Solirubrobacterales bacterium]
MTDRLKANRELVRRLYEEVFSAGRLDVVDELMTDDYVNHDPPPGAGHTREDVKVIATGFRERIPGFRARVDRIVAEGDFVAVQGTASGSAASPEIKLGEFFRIERGRIAERWG